MKSGLPRVTLLLGRIMVLFLQRPGGKPMNSQLGGASTCVVIVLPSGLPFDYYPPASLGSLRGKPMN